MWDQGPPGARRSEPESDLESESESTAVAGKQIELDSGSCAPCSTSERILFQVAAGEPASLGHAGVGWGALGSDSGEANLEAYYYWYNELLRFEQLLRDSLTVASFCTRARMVQLKKLDVL